MFLFIYFRFYVNDLRQLLGVFLVLTCQCCCFLFAVILVAQGKRLKGEVYSLIPSLIRRIDRACESYSPSTIHFFVVATNPIIVPPHSTPPRRPLRIRAGLWPFLFLIFLFFFSYFFSSLLSFLMEYGFSAPILFLSQPWVLI